MADLDAKLDQFVQSFFGYGSWSAPVWFVGMEEGGGGSEDEIANRIERWDERGRFELEDLAEYHRSIGVTRHFGERPAPQMTWSKLIYLLFGLRGWTATSELVRRYQSTRLGRFAGETSLLELLPLPSPGTNRWLYGEVSDLPWLANRLTYQQRLLSKRAAQLRERVARHRPQTVVFYGWSYLQWWSSIAATDLLAVPDESFAMASSTGTTFAAVRHPVARGTTNAHFRRVGELIAHATRDA